MNIYIDLGCYDGDTIGWFKDWSKTTLPSYEAWAIHAFDANPGFEEQWEAIKNDSTHFYQKAIWTEDTQLTFAVDSTETPMGSTAMSGKKNIWDDDVYQKIQVEAIDFSGWLKQFENDFVVIKMDIEGAEFPVLRKMIQDGTISIPKYLFVEFHPNKVVEYTTTDKDNLIAELESLGVNIQEWH